MRRTQTATANPPGNPVPHNASLVTGAEPRHLLSPWCVISMVSLMDRMTWFAKNAIRHWRRTGPLHALLAMSRDQNKQASGSETIELSKMNTNNYTICSGKYNSSSMKLQSQATWDHMPPTPTPTMAPWSSTEPLLVPPVLPAPSHPIAGALRATRALGAFPPSRVRVAAVMNRDQE